LGQLTFNGLHAEGNRETLLVDVVSMLLIMWCRE
jgi:hypothetical protein